MNICHYYSLFTVCIRTGGYENWTANTSDDLAESASTKPCSRRLLRTSSSQRFQERSQDPRVHGARCHGWSHSTEQGGGSPSIGVATRLLPCGVIQPTQAHRYDQKGEAEWVWNNLGLSSETILWETRSQTHCFALQGSPEGQSWRRGPEKAAQVKWVAWHELSIALKVGIKHSSPYSQLSTVTTQGHSVLFAQLSKMAGLTPPSPTPQGSSKPPTIFFLP